MTSQYSLTKSWTLLRYALEIHHHSPLSSQNSSPSSSNERQQLQRLTIDFSEGPLKKIECVDLSSPNPSAIFATYTGDSLLMSYLIPNDNIQRKFLIKFASTTNQNGRQHCQDCVKLLSRLINITHFDSISLSSMTNPIEKPNSILSITDMTKALMGDASIKLPRYYNQEIPFDLNQPNAFLEKYLCDETFPDFVANVASILDTMKEA
ncbi:unnamed protein product [Rotaria magnacalcarata]|uniref:Uncharacterized protein n=1 Tax=Rotaria magnacalcarata TaxID=392030 RepID=A0A816MSA7_9BILA|nr:unnamed protein product [Rotaria magnacalcarata]